MENFMAGFRTIVINRRCKLESQLGTLVIRGESEERVHISEIETLLVESTAVALTAALVADLTAAGANIIFCDRTHLPVAVFLPVHAHFSTAKNIREQIAWTADMKSKCRALIVKEKIRQQALHLRSAGDAGASDLLMDYQARVADGDVDNCEATAASIYFRAIFGQSFSRNTACFENNALNYGYTLLMSVFAREISACGFLTELGLWHKSVENAFNLASDAMEPFRVGVDRIVVNMSKEQQETYKRHMLEIMYSRVKINGENQSLVPAIRIYLHRIFKFMRGEADSIYGIEMYGNEE
jgi:CRISPR-associated endonuclease Cas1 subtype II